MTDVSPNDHGRSVARYAPPAPDSKAEKIRKTFAHIRRQFLAPFDEWEKASAVGATERLKMVDRPAYLAPRVFQPVHPTSEDHRLSQLRAFDSALMNQPGPAPLSDLRAQMGAAANGPPVPAANRLIAGAMVGAFPNVRPHSPETYLEALIEALDHTGLPPAAIAKTCNDIVMTSTFAPSVAEVLAAAKNVQANLAFGVKQIDRYAEVVAWADQVRGWLTSVPLIAPDRSNVERPPAPPATLVRHRSGVDWV